MYILHINYSDTLSFKIVVVLPLLTLIFCWFSELNSFLTPSSLNQWSYESDRTSHQQSKSYCCPSCGKKYSWKRNLQRHLSLECGKEPRQKCPYCPYVTNHKSSVQKHIRRKHENMSNISHIIETESWQVHFKTVWFWSLISVIWVQEMETKGCSWSNWLAIIWKA